MFAQVKIKNFKSIKDLEFSSKRVNVFIGEPNTGKSNVLEALAFFSPGTHEAAREVLRFKETADLFFDQKINHEISVDVGNWKMVLGFDSSKFEGAILWQPLDGTAAIPKAGFSMDHLGHVGHSVLHPELTKVRYYRFKSMGSFPNGVPGILSPPFGDNLVSVLNTNENLGKQVRTLFKAKGFRLLFKPTEKEVFLTKEVNDELYSYPWNSISETLQRIVFYMAVLETNKNSVLLLDEPEANTFPFYTKYLAERIALDETNQFFITTHNPYLLSSIVEKTGKKDLAVFVAKMNDFETKLNAIPEKKLPELLELDADAFFNLDRLVEE